MYPSPNKLSQDYLHVTQVSPSDGRVLHFGVVEDKQVEQVKGVTYHLDRFLGPEEALVIRGSVPETASEEVPRGVDQRIAVVDSRSPHQENCIFHVVIYLAPGDYHHFHSPSDWSAHKRRHFPGELDNLS